MIRVCYISYTATSWLPVATYMKSYTRITIGSVKKWNPMSNTGQLMNATIQLKFTALALMTKTM